VFGHGSKEETVKRLIVVLAAATVLSAVPAAEAAPVPATLSLTVGPPPAFGVFTPGVARTYDALTTANVISTADAATLTVEDDTGNVVGHLVNGTFSLPSPVQAQATSAGGIGGAFAPVGGTALTLLTYPGPVSNDAVTLAFRQSIGANDALRTGTYAKEVTLTLSATSPCTMSVTAKVNVNGTGSSSGGTASCETRTIETLIASVQALGLPRGTNNSLLQKLTGAQAANAKGNTGSACAKLASFETAVQSGKTSKLIDPATVQGLIEDTDAVRASLGCS
jgi:hypothetical protein